MTSISSPPARASGHRLIAIAAVIHLCGVTPSVADERSRLTEEVQEAQAALIKHDASIKGEIAKAAGYALFPGVGKGAIGIGGARGTGQVMVKGAPIAKVTLTQVTVGLQLGGQKYVELILFENKKALDQFLGGSFTMAAQATRLRPRPGRPPTPSTRAA